MLAEKLQDGTDDLEWPGKDSKLLSQHPGLSPLPPVRRPDDVDSQS
jgi:hypothetical protein